MAPMAYFCKGKKGEKICEHRLLNQINIQINKVSVQIGSV